jgi:hypothetical protein
MATALGIVLAACSTGALDPDGGGVTPDAGKCVGDLATVGAWCPPMFDGSEANVPACSGFSPSQQVVWRCQDLIILLDNYGLGGDVCYYDAASHALVGAEHGTDYPAYCRQTSSAIEAGRTDPMCRENAPTFQRSCDRPDGGGGVTQDGGKCVGDLAMLGASCPPVFDGTEANLPACVSVGLYSQQTVWRCQDLIVLMDSTGYGGSTCYYDATSHALVGAEQASDVGVYCGQTSVRIEAGRTDSMCRENAPTVQRSCAPSDGGSGS